MIFLKYTVELLKTLWCPLYNNHTKFDWHSTGTMRVKLKGRSKGTDSTEHAALSQLQWCLPVDALCEAHIGNAGSILSQQVNMRVQDTCVHWLAVLWQHWNTQISQWDPHFICNQQTHRNLSGETHIQSLHASHIICMFYNRWYLNFELHANYISITTCSFVVLH